MQCMNTTVNEIAALVGGTVVGNGAIPITGINGIRQAASGDLTFLADTRYVNFLSSTHASAILVRQEIERADQALIQVDDPYMAVAVVLKRIQADNARPPEGIHPTATIHPSVELGEGVAVGPYVTIEEGCQVGARTHLYAGVVIAHSSVVGADCVLHANVVFREQTVVGDRCIIHAGAVLGSDGFGFASLDGKHEKIPQVGTVVLGNDVEIGANTTIDRATFGQTVVGEGTKIDNLVQIGHNTRIGKHTVICGNAGIAGSTIIGDRVTIAAGAGIAGHLEVGDGAVIGGYSGVSKSVRPGQKVFGYPAVEYGRSKRMHGALRQLPDALRQMRTLEQRIAQLEGQLNGTAEDDS
ncbi:MAG: UDP-3-O-(3-hydroxymyristoyl)glucosamine N-acyltransferase [bacterium]|nr:UDP-3-O-(3-hydroxymyristoyl)glucosamine N-acyltransferase [bacterium]